MPNDFISREALDALLYRKQMEYSADNERPAIIAIQEARLLLQRFPAADVAPVKRGRWVDGHCDQCGCYAEDDRIGGNFYTAYCANCGAKMTVSARMDAKEGAHAD